MGLAKNNYENYNNYYVMGYEVVKNKKIGNYATFRCLKICRMIENFKKNLASPMEIYV